MRVKQIWAYIPIPAKLKLLADRITFSKLTLFYFIFSVVHCIIQIVFQVQAFNINMNAAHFLSDIITQGNATQPGFMVLGQDLRMCTTVPATLDASSCPVVWNGQAVKTNGTGTSGMTGMPAQNVAEGWSGMSLSSSQAVPSATSTSASASSSSPSSSATPSTSLSASSEHASVTASSSSSLASASSSNASKSKSTVTVTVRPTISDLSNVKTDVAVITISHTVTVTSGAAASTSSNAVKAEGAVLREKRINPKVVLAAAPNGSKEIQIDGLPGVGDVTLSESCLLALNWPVTRVDNTKRQDLVFIGFQVWVLGMSLVAILNESPPHIVATFLTHMLATAWAGYQLFSTNQFHSDFARLTTHGACGVNLLPVYWTERARFEIPTLALNCLALVISAFLSWRLLKQFGWQTFKRIGASLTMSRAYRIILIFSIVIQLSLFFIVVAVALWIDQVYNGDIARLTTRHIAFRAIDITILIIVLPWLTAGWLSVRREYKYPMLAFLVFALIYLGGWGAMFASATFRWTFVEWQFFSLMATASVILTLTLFILGLFCRLNFGKGLARYLSNSSQETLVGDDFVPATLPYDGSSSEKFDEEKFAFPAYESPVPTFAAAYGEDDGPAAPAPAHVPLGARILGPRFFSSHTGGGAGDSLTVPVQLPSADRRAQGHLARQGSGSSQRSGSSVAWSVNSDDAPSMKGRRWVIE